jgi:hypothetical protein
MFEYIAVTNSSEPERCLSTQSRHKTTMEGLSDPEDSEHGWSSEEYAEHVLLVERTVQDIAFTGTF